MLNVILFLSLLFFPAVTSASQQSDISGGNFNDRPVKIALLNNFPPFAFTVKQKLMGFTFDYINLLEDKTGLDLEIVEGTWEENLDRFKNGEVDMITAISYTEERTSFTRYTEPYYIIPTVVYTRQDSFTYQGVQDLKGKTVGIESGVFYKKYLDKYPDVDIKEVEETDELLKQLSFDQIDAVITNINIGNYMIKKHMLENVNLAGRIDIPEIKDEDLRIGVRRELTKLHSIIQAGMNQVSPREYKTLQDRWVGFTPSDMLQGSLLPREQKLIKKYNQKYGGVRLSCGSNWFPVDFLDANNAHKGIAVDIFSSIDQKQEISFVFRKTENFKDNLAAVEKGKADVIPALVPTPELKQKFSFTKPYLSLPLVVATSRKEIFIKDLSSLKNKQIGYVDRGMLSSVLSKKYPNLSFTATDSVRKGLQRIQKEKDYAFIGTVPTITYAIQKHDFYDIKISGTLQEKLPIAAAVKKGDTTLLNVVQKGLSSIPLSKRESILNNWISIRLEENVDYTVVWLVTGGALFIISIVILWTRKVYLFNSQLSEAYQLLEQKNQELENLSITDKLTGLFNRSKIEAELKKEQMRFDRLGTTFSIIIFDIDWFKSINDTYGHTTGDKALQDVADLIKNRVRKTDIAGRWGGEEFIVICPGTGTKGAETVAEDIRKNIQDHSFGLETGVTISAGISTYTDQLRNIEELVNSADMNMYRAKEHKNCVCSPGNAQEV